MNNDDKTSQKERKITELNEKDYDDSYRITAITVKGSTLM